MNKIKATGFVANEPAYSREIYGEKFYKFDLKSERLSGATDILPCVVSETIMPTFVESGANIEVLGEIRTRNYTDGEGKRRCEISIFANRISERFERFRNDNDVILEGYICKEPNYRETPLGRQICDVLIASNRERCGKSDYIPSVAWGRNALRVSQMGIGTKVDIVGRLQSREYIKHLEDGTDETRVAYELSICKIKESETDEN